MLTSAEKGLVFVCLDKRSMRVYCQVAPADFDGTLLETRTLMSSKTVEFSPTVHQSLMPRSRCHMQNNPSQVVIIGSYCLNHNLAISTSLPCCS